jgi:hypothetical protein
MKKLAIAFVAASTMLLSGAASAMPFGDTAPATQSLMQKAYYHHWHHGGWGGPRFGFYGGGYGYGGGGCYGARHLCASRWGWGGPGFGRCLWRHGC